jgi:hypothetical protein
VLAREERDLVIAANNSHVLAFDNLSGLPHALYTDADEVLFQAARPILLNGIGDVISRPDLADRAILVTLPPIRDTRRRSERQIWRDFELACWDLCSTPRYSGCATYAIFNSNSFPGWQTLRCGPRHAKRRSGRVQANHRGAIEALIDADPVAARVREIMASRVTWTGTASELLRMGSGSVLLSGNAQAGQEAPGNSPAGCVVRRHSFGTKHRGPFRA